MSCVWCEDEELANMLMEKMVTFHRNLSKEEYQKAIPDLFVCDDCVIAYHRVKKKFQMTSDQKLGLLHVEQVRLNHFLQQLTKKDKKDNNIFIEHPSVRELLSYPYLLMKKEIYDTFVNEINVSLNDPHDNIVEDELWCGIFLILLDTHQKVHNWACVWIESFTLIDNDNFYIFRPILTCILKIFLDNLYENSNATMEDITEINEETILPGYILKDLTVERLLNAIDIIFKCLHSRVLKRLLMNDYNKNFFVKLLDRNKKKTCCLDTELRLLQTLLEKLVSSFWLLPGNFDNPKTLFDIIIALPSFVASTSFYIFNGERPIYCVNDQTLIIKWMLPFVKSIIHFDSKETLQTIIKFHLPILNSTFNNSIPLFKCGADSFLSILTHVCEISRVDLLAGCGRMISESMLFLLNFGSKNKNIMPETSIHCASLSIMVVKHGMYKETINRDCYMMFDANLSDLQNSKGDTTRFRDVITFVVDKATPVKLEMIEEDESTDEAYKQLMIMESVASQLAQGSAEQPITLSDSDDEQEDEYNNDDKSRIKLLPMHCIGSQSPVVLSDDEDEAIDKPVDFAVEGTQDENEEEVIYRITKRKRKLLLSDSEDDDDTDNESLSDNKENDKIIKPSSTTTLEVKIHRLDEDLLRYHKTKQLVAQVEERKKKEKEDIAPPSSKLKVNKSLVTKPKPRKTTCLRRERIENSLSLITKPSNRTLPVVETKRKYTPGIFIECILSWKVTSLEENMDELSLKAELQAVPFSFECYDDYMKTFWPLLLLETWAQLRKEWADYGSHSRGIPFVVDSFEEQNTGQKSGYLKCSHYTKDYLTCPSEDDLVVLKFSNDLKMFALVERCEKTWVHQNRKKLRLFTLTIKLKDVTLIPSQSTVNVRRVTSLTTVTRQWNGMIGFPQSLLAKDLLKPFREKTFHLKEKPVERKDRLKILNEAQFHIVSNVFRAVNTPYVIPRICLLQGPPGTGKSYTIKTIITQLLKDKQWNEHLKDDRELHRDRILLCAPSNAALDELCTRLIKSPPRKEGGKDRAAKQPSNINCGDFRLIRIGRKPQVDPFVYDHSLEFLLETGMKKFRQNNDKIMLKRKAQQYLKALGNLDDVCVKLKMASNVEKKKQFLEKNEERSNLQQKYDALVKHCENLSGGSFDYHKEEEKYQLHLLLGADIICCTLNGAGSKIMQKTFMKYFDRSKVPFKCVIIDEAGQCTEPDALIPLQYKTSKLVLVGDPAQLPATVLSQKAARFNYGQSLFERLYNALAINNKDTRPAALLNIQYRMLPGICSFPSSRFYDSQLVCAKELHTRSKKTYPLKPYVLIDITGSREEKSGEGSLHNSLERDHIIEICRALKSGCKHFVNLKAVSVITPYRKQMSLIQSQLKSQQIEVSVNTIDAYQGQEREVVILSSVRANDRNNSIGFLKNPQRMNVALTRARQSLIILTDCKTLQVDDDWNALIEDSKKRGVYFNVHSTKDTIDCIFTDKWKSLLKESEVENKEAKESEKMEIDRKVSDPRSNSTSRNKTDQSKKENKPFLKRSADETQLNNPTSKPHPSVQERNKKTTTKIATAYKIATASNALPDVAASTSRSSIESGSKATSSSQNFSTMTNQLATSSSQSPSTTTNQLAKTTVKPANELKLNVVSPAKKKRRKSSVSSIVTGDPNIKSNPTFKKHPVTESAPSSTPQQINIPITPQHVCTTPERKKNPSASQQKSVPTTSKPKTIRTIEKIPLSKVTETRPSNSSLPVSARPSKSSLPVSARPSNNSVPVSSRHSDSSVPVSARHSDNSVPVSLPLPYSTLNVRPDVESTKLMKDIKPVTKLEESGINNVSKDVQLVTHSDESDLDNVVDMLLELPFEERDKSGEKTVDGVHATKKKNEIKRRLSNTLLLNKGTSSLQAKDKPILQTKDTPSVQVTPLVYPVKKTVVKSSIQLLDGCKEAAVSKETAENDVNPPGKKQSEKKAAAISNLAKTFNLDEEKRKILESALAAILSDNVEAEDNEEQGIASYAAHTDNSQVQESTSPIQVGESTSPIQVQESGSRIQMGESSSQLQVSQKVAQNFTEDSSKSQMKELKSSSGNETNVTINQPPLTIVPSKNTQLTNSQEIDIRAFAKNSSLKTNPKVEPNSKLDLPKNNLTITCNKKEVISNTICLVSPTITDNQKRREAPSGSYFKLPHTHSDGTNCKLQCARLVAREARRKQLNREDSGSGEQSTSPNIMFLSQHSPNVTTVQHNPPNEKDGAVRTSKESYADKLLMLKKRRVDGLKQKDVTATTNPSLPPTTINTAKPPTPTTIKATSSVDPRLQKNKVFFPDQRSETMVKCEDNMDISPVLETPITLNQPANMNLSINIPKSPLTSTSSPLHFQFPKANAFHGYTAYFNMMQNIMETNPNSTFSPSVLRSPRIEDSNFLASRTFNELVDQLRPSDRQYLHNYAAGFATAILMGSQNSITPRETNTISIISDEEAKDAIKMFKSNVDAPINELPPELKNLPTDQVVSLLKLLLPGKDHVDSVYDVSEVKQESNLYNDAYHLSEDDTVQWTNEPIPSSVSENFKDISSIPKVASDNGIPIGILKMQDHFTAKPMERPTMLMQHARNSGPVGMGFVLNTLTETVIKPHCDEYNDRDKRGSHQRRRSDGHSTDDQYRRYDRRHDQPKRSRRRDEESYADRYYSPSYERRRSHSREETRDERRRSQVSDSETSRLDTSFEPQLPKQRRKRPKKEKIKRARK